MPAAGSSSRMYAGRPHQGAANGDTALIRIRQGSGDAGAQRADADPVEHRFRFGDGCAPAHSQTNAGYLQIVQHRQVAEEPPTLEGAGDAAPADLMRLETRECRPVELDGAFRRSLEARQHVDQRGLASAIGADEANDAPRRNLEVHR
ncbi:hypothetical protein ACVINZ_005179 [Mesorhizobium jarvisii]